LSITRRPIIASDRYVEACSAGCFAAEDVAVVAVADMMSRLLQLLGRAVMDVVAIAVLVLICLLWWGFTVFADKDD